MNNLKLFDVIEVIGGGTPKRSVADYWNGDIDWLTVNDFNTDGRYVHSADEKITELGLNKSSTKMLAAGDLIISARGTVGCLAQLTKPMAFNQSCYGIRGKENLDNDFLYYFLKTKITELQRNSHGAVFDTITTNTFKILSINLPPLAEQKAISSVLGELDDKIENNRRMNETLKEMARAIFKSWFVDFDPVHTKAAGDSPSNMDVDTAALFPSSFGVDGLPKGWKEVEFGELIIPKKGKMITKKTALNGDIPVVAGGLKPAYYHNAFNAKAPVVTISASGNAGFVNIYYKNIWASDCSFINYEISDYVYLSHSFLKFNQEKLFNMQTGAVQQHIYPSDIMRLKIIFGSIQILEKYEQITSNYYKKIAANYYQNDTLAELRDILLPKLMSGEIRLKDAEREVETAL